ncbi:MAG: GNAT family protein, partial [Acidimicrobiia bacterium]|nr:GNAT family protein [Acidimicrobiia bacterium]
MFEPIRTDRLVLRAFEASDLDAFHARRNDPDVARYQNWTMPYPRERASKVVDEVIAMAGPANDDWWMGTVALADTGEVIGDFAINLTWDSR